MSKRVERFIRRQTLKKYLKNRPQIPALIDVKASQTRLLEKADTSRMDICINEFNEANRIDWNTIIVSDNEVSEFIDQFDDKEAAIEALIEPAFLSLIDGSMRAFKLGTKQGLTATRIYNECRSFSYDQTGYIDSKVDRLTEYINERDARQSYGQTANYRGGVFNRDGEAPLNMRDQSKMNGYKEDYFAGRDTAEDEYAPGETIYKDNETAFTIAGRSGANQNRHEQSAETDHIIPCTVLCNELKKNKALHSEDIKEILNDVSNLAVTSRDINNGKRGMTNEKFVKINKEYLPDELNERMLEKSQKARASIDRNTNRKAKKNIISNRTVQTRLSKDAAGAAGHRAIGDAIIFLIKPLHFELKDCLTNGIENGIDASDFKNALKIRMGRMGAYVERNLKGMFQGGIENFIRSFFSMLIEGILQCFVGIFKHITRAVSEGVRIFIQAIPILNDNTKNTAEKGDAILKMIAFSSTALVGIGIESYLNTLGLSEPWSIIAASIFSTVIMALVMYTLEKVDLFNLKHDKRRARIEETLSLIKSEADEALKNLIDPGKKFREFQKV